MNECVDVAALKPRDEEQLGLLADRLQVRLPREWLRTLRWAGRAGLVTGADDVAAERVLSAAKEAGVRTAVWPSHPMAVGARAGPGSRGHRAHAPRALHGRVVQPSQP